MQTKSNEFNASSLKLNLKYKANSSKLLHCPKRLNYKIQNKREFNLFPMHFGHVRIGTFTNGTVCKTKFKADTSMCEY